MPSEDAHPSAYHYICDSLERMPGTPYAFQNPATAGKEDVTFSLFHNDMPPSLQEKFAKICCDELVTSVEQQVVSENLSGILHGVPTFTYAVALLRRIKEYLDEGLLAHDPLYRFGLMLARECSEICDVKLGIFILGQFPNDITKAILRTLGLHSEFTLTVILSTETWPGANTNIFELAKETTGYGRLASAIKFAPLTLSKQAWLFYEALKTPICRDVIAAHTLFSVDMESFYSALSLDETVFHSLSRLFTYAFLETDAKAYPMSKMLVEKYMTVAGKYVKEFIDLAALVMIEKSMRPDWAAVNADEPKENGWSNSAERQVIEQCEKYQRSLKFRQARLVAEMDNPVEDNAVITKVLTSLSFDDNFSLPDFSAFVHMLDRDPFDMNIAEFVLIDHSKDYAKEVAQRILAVTPYDVLNGPEIIDKDSLTPEYRPDVWLIYLLKARKVVKFECEHICLSCLSARFQELRIEAINALRLTRSQWSDSVIPALERACEKEPEPKIVKRIKRLLGIKVDDKKEQRYVDVADVAITPSAADKAILDTEIAGTFFRDMDVVTGVLESGDTLFLKREPDNKYDCNAILVTTEDGYVLGYIPKVENPPLAQFMDAGERLYAVLEVDPTAYEGKPPITVMVSKAPVKQGKVIQFPGGQHS